MKNLNKKLLITLLLLFTVFGVVSCDQTDTTTAVETTTIEGSTTTTTFEDTSRLEMFSPYKLVYAENETLDLLGLVVTYYDSDNNATVLTESDYTVGTVDMSTGGFKTVEITYLTYTTSFTIEVISSVVEEGYYSSVNASSGESLILSLHALLSTTYKGVTYGDARDILQETDEDPNNPNNIILVYTRTSIVSTWDSGQSWNREHVWPRSYLPDTSVNNNSISSASDLHNLKPSDPGENSSRSNDFFSATLSSGYEPHDDVKGDVARIMFYMAIMYEMTLVDGTPGYLEMGQLSELLQWHIDDPVDDFERNRNDVIFDYQENRNPFIDHPEWVALIWN